MIYMQAYLVCRRVHSRRNRRIQFRRTDHPCRMPYGRLASDVDREECKALKTALR